jgi:hypothetical protein
MQQLELPPEISASIDWFSGSIRETAKRLAAERLFGVVADHATKLGEKTLDSTWKGYDLHRVGGLTWGRRTADDYLELRSDAAAAWWLSFYPTIFHVARIDLAVTWKPPARRLNLAKLLYQTTCNRNDRGANPPQLRYFETFGGGQTMYVGSSKSDRLARIYDKGAEMGVPEPGYLWRYELQLRNDPAGHIAAEIVASTAQGRLVASVVGTYLRQRYVTCDWANRLDEVPMVIHRPKSSDEIRKAWLYRTVRPVLVEMQKRMASEELRELLALA